MKPYDVLKKLTMGNVFPSVSEEQQEEQLQCERIHVECLQRSEEVEIAYMEMQKKFVVGVGNGYALVMIPDNKEKMQRLCDKLFVMGFYVNPVSSRDEAETMIQRHNGSLRVAIVHPQNKAQDGASLLDMIQGFCGRFLLWGDGRPEVAVKTHIDKIQCVPSDVSVDVLLKSVQIMSERNGS